MTTQQIPSLASVTPYRPVAKILTKHYIVPDN